MVAASLAVISLAFAASGVTASAVTSRNQALSSLMKARQGSIIDPGDIPTQCQSTCTTLVTVFNSCSTDSSTCLQICTNTVMSSVAQCLSCSVTAQGNSPSTRSQAQEALTELESDCAQAGSPVSSFTVSGAASTPAASGSATASATRSVPIATGTSQSIFFSSGSAAASASASGAAPSSSAAVPSNTATSPVGTISKQTVTALSTSPTASPVGSNTATASDLNPSATAGASSGATKTAAVSVLAFLGAAAVFAVQL